MTSFMEEYRAGRVTSEDIDRWVDEWRNSKPGSPAAQVDLYDWLGMTWYDYQGFVITNEINRDPVEVARLQRSIEQARNGQTVPWRIAMPEL